ncbi:MAG: RNA polymerase sigma factor [Kofleriaceae bacterium]|nr:RNA polymerase sigma factor [Kofleriaceae bacterium]
MSAAYIEDVVLVDRCIGGEQAAARDLFRRHRARVHASLFRVLGGNRDMDDLMQETFLQVFQSLPQWRAEASLATWIDRIAVRVAYRWLRRRGPAPPPLELFDDDAVVPASLGGVRRQLARDGVRRLYAALDQVTPAARIAFTLHEIDGRSVAEVAELTGATVTATKVRLWRARRQLDAVKAGDPVLRELLDGTGGAA